MDWKTQKPLEELKLLYLMMLLYLPMMPDDVDLHDYVFIPGSVIVPGSVFLRPSAPIITSNSSWLTGWFFGLTSILQPSSGQVHRYTESWGIYILSAFGTER